MDRKTLTLLNYIQIIWNNLNSINDLINFDKTNQPTVFCCWKHLKRHFTWRVVHHFILHLLIFLDIYWYLSIFARYLVIFQCVRIRNLIIDLKKGVVRHQDRSPLALDSTKVTSSWSCFKKVVSSSCVRVWPPPPLLGKRWNDYPVHHTDITFLNHYKCYIDIKYYK